MMERGAPQAIARQSPPRGLAGPIRPRAAFAFLAAIHVTLIATITVIAVPLPTIQDELGLTSMDLVLVSAGYGLTFSGLLLLGGRLADLFGRRRILVTGLLVFGLAAATAGLAPSFGTLLTARFAQGAGAALAAPAAMALVTTVIPDPAQRSRVLAAWGVLAGIGATAGLLVSGVLITWVSWRWAFVWPATVAVVATLIAPRLLPPGPPPQPLRLDIRGALLVTAGLTMLSFGLTRIGETGPSSGSFAILIGAAIALAMFARVERRAVAPLLPPTLLAVPGRVVALTVVMLGSAGHATVSFFLILYLQQVRHLSPLATSAALLPFAVGLLSLTPFAGRVVGRVGARATATGGLTIGAAGLLLLSRIGVDTPYAGILLAGLLVFPAGVAMVFAGGTVAAVAGVPDDQAGVAGGAVNTAIETGPTVGLALLASLAAAHTSQLLSSGFDVDAAATGGYAFALAAAGVIYVAAAGLTAVVLRPPSTAESGSDAVGRH